MKTALVLLLAVAASVAACSKSEPPPAPVAAAQPAPLPNSNIFSADVRTLQKAKDVQKTMDQRKADLDKQLNEADQH